MWWSIAGIVFTWIAAHFYYRRTIHDARSSTASVNETLRATRMSLKASEAARRSGEESVKRIDALSVYIRGTGAVTIRRETEHYDSLKDTAHQGDFLRRYEVVVVDLPYPVGDGVIEYRIVVRRVNVGQGSYAVTFTLHAPGEEETEFLRLDVSESLERIETSDFDGDGLPEVAILYYCGAHSRGFRLFKFDSTGQLEIVPGSDEIGSDFPSVAWGDFDGDGVVEIIARHRNWEDQEAGFCEQVFKFDGDRYGRVSEELVSYGDSKYPMDMG